MGRANIWWEESPGHDRLRVGLWEGRTGTRRDHRYLGQAAAIQHAGLPGWRGLLQPAGHSILRPTHEMGCEQRAGR